MKRREYDGTEIEKRKEKREKRKEKRGWTRKVK